MPALVPVEVTSLQPVTIRSPKSASLLLGSGVKKPPSSTLAEWSRPDGWSMPVLAEITL